MIQATGKVSQAQDDEDFEFVVSVVAYVECDEEEEDEILDRLETCLVDCDIECNMTIFDIDFDYSYTGDSDDE